VLQQYDPIYTSTARHFSDLGARYGHPVVVLNLLRAKERRWARGLEGLGALFPVGHRSAARPTRPALARAPRVLGAR
jgi:hypothetical protein